MALSQKGQAFIEYVLADEKLNAAQAAIKAGYSKATAEKHAYMWIQDDESKCGPQYINIWKAFQEAKAKRNERNEIDADYVLKRLIDIDEMDVMDIMDDDLNIKPLSQWPKCWRTTLSGIDILELKDMKKDDTQSLIKKIKWPDKVKNLELLGKHVTVQAFKEQKEVSGDLTMNLISELSERNAKSQVSPLPKDNM